MADRDDEITSVPLMPTGNGVTDLEIAREQAAVADQQSIDDGAAEPQAEAPVDDDRPTLSE